MSLYQGITWADSADVAVESGPQRLVTQEPLGCGSQHGLHPGSRGARQPAIALLVAEELPASVGAGEAGCSSRTTASVLPSGDVAVTVGGAARGDGLSDVQAGQTPVIAASSAQVTRPSDCDTEPRGFVRTSFMDRFWFKLDRTRQKLRVAGSIPAAPMG